MDIFNFFFSGEWKGESEAPGREGLMFIENPRKGVGVSEERGGGEREGVWLELGGWG